MLAFVQLLSYAYAYAYNCTYQRRNDAAVSGFRYRQAYVHTRV